MPVGIGSGSTLNDIVYKIQTLLGTDASLGATEVQALVETRFQWIFETWNWSRRLRDFLFATVAQLSSDATNTLTVTTGASTVTALGAAPFTTAMVGRQIALTTSLQYYFVNAVVDPTHLVLGDGEGNTVPYPFSSASAVGWRMFRTIYPMPVDCDAIEVLAEQYRLQEYEGGRTVLDRDDPYRQSTSNAPTHWCYAGESMTGQRELELWPVASSSTLIRGQYIRKAPPLVGTDPVPLPAPLLIYGGAADCCHLLHSKQGTTEQMWENKALFFERKLTEIMTDYKIVDQPKTSPLMQLGRRPRGYAPEFSGDYLVNHQVEGPWYGG